MLLYKPHIVALEQLTFSSLSPHLCLCWGLRRGWGVRGLLLSQRFHLVKGNVSVRAGDTHYRGGEGAWLG